VIRRVATVALIALVAVSCSGRAAGPRPSVATVPNWALAGGNLDNSRAATATAWSVATAAGAEVAWTAKLPGIGSLPTVPIVVGGTVYVGGTAGGVVALERSTGRIRWRSEPTGPTIGPTGVAVDGGRVFGLNGSTGVVALDAGTGRRLWVRDIVATPTTGVDIQPVVAGGVVLVSTVPVSIKGIYAPGDRGVIHALDVRTGDDVWTFDTVQGDLWGHPELNSGGGAWYPPAIDPKRGLAYFGIANPAPFPGAPGWPNGTSRPGPNLYTDSVVALDLDTGALRWFDQVSPHDIFDRDQVFAMIAHTAHGDVVVSSGKSGVVVGVDPATGKERWRTEVGRHQNDDLQALTGPTKVLPGTFGGILTPPATADGIVYLPVINAGATLGPEDRAYFATPLGQEDGDVAAVDAGTGRVLWSRKVAGDPLGGVTVVGDLLLVPLADGTLLGLDRATGKVVWHDKLPGGTNGQPAVSGDLAIFPVGSADPPQLVAYRVHR
jgi:alcohol dehydrogenase (cytochrome c)